MKSKFFLVLIVVAFALSACAIPTPAPTAAPTQAPTEAPTQAPTEAPTAEPTPESTSFTVTDALDRTVTFDKVPERIAVVGKGVFMVADAIYAFPETSTRLVAVAAMNQKSASFLKMIDVEYDSKQSIDRSAGPEQIAALQPDCVVLKTTNPDLITGLEALQIPVVAVAFETPEQYASDIATLGQLFQNPERAAVVAGYYQEGVQAVTDGLADLTEEEKPSVLLLYYNEEDGAIAFNVAPASWIQTTMVELAGGKPVWTEAQLEKGWTKVSFEQLAAWNPEVIVVTAYSLSIPEVVETLKADAQWQQLEAVKNGKLYGMAADVYSFDQPDTRWIMGVEWMAATLHPEHFPGFDLATSAQEFYQTIYNMDVVSFQQNILPILSGAE